MKHLKPLKNTLTTCMYSQHPDLLLQRPDKNTLAPWTMGHDMAWQGTEVPQEMAAATRLSVAQHRMEAL
jgi:hypothetical protein